MKRVIIFSTLNIKLFGLNYKRNKLWELLIQTMQSLQLGRIKWSFSCTYVFSFPVEEQREKQYTVRMASHAAITSIRFTTSPDESKK